MNNMAKYPGIKCRECGKEDPHCSCRPLNLTWAGFPIQLQERWQANYESKRTIKRFSRKTIKEAANLHRNGYRQTSRKYMMVGKSFNDSIELSQELFDCFRRIQRYRDFLRTKKYRIKGDAKKAYFDRIKLLSSPNGVEFDESTVVFGQDIIKILKDITNKFGNLIFPSLSPCEDGSVDLYWNHDNARFLINIKQGIIGSDFYGTDGVANISGTFDPVTFKYEYLYSMLRRCEVNQ